MADMELTQKMMKGRNARDIAERKKKKEKKKTKRNDGAVIVLKHIDLQSKLNRSRRSRGRQKGKLPSQEAPSEKEKLSLRAWVERWMKPQCKFKAVQDKHGDTDVGGSAERISDFGAESGSHGCGEKSLSNGQNCLSSHHFERYSLEACNGHSSHEGHRHGVSEKEFHQSTTTAPSGEVSVICRMHTCTHGGRLLNASEHGESECNCLVIARTARERGLSAEHKRSGKENLTCQTLDVEVSHNSSLLKGDGSSVSLSNSADSLNNKRKREVDKVLQYVLKRNVVIHSSLSEPVAKRSRTTKSVVDAWGKNIPVTLTSEAHTVEEWVFSQNANLFGLDVEWRPNRTRGEKNKVALLQICNGSECLIVQMLFLDRKPQALRKLLSDPLKSLAGVGVLADGKRLLHDYGLECQGSIELTTLAVERLKRDELRHVGLKVLVQEVLGLNMHKPKKVTLSNWAKVELDPAQINYACMDAWASFALSQKLLADV